MTHLIIHPNILDRNKYLLEFLSENLGRTFTEIIQLHNIADIHIIEKGQSDSIGIDEVKKLQKDMIFHPLELSYQAGIIFHSANLTMEAQNSLLKSLEEQPDTTLYILMVGNEKDLLETIVSRCTKHYVKVSAKSQVLRTKEEETEQEPEILKLDLVDQFDSIATIVEGEDNEMFQLLENLHRYYKKQLENAIISGNNNEAKIVIKSINSVNVAQTRLRANANKKLTLENLMLRLQK
jgi:acylphosphatase